MDALTTWKATRTIPSRRDACAPGASPSRTTSTTPSRVIYPQKRAKEERGNADAWERCSWDEALDIIMDNWRRLTDEYGRETMAIFVGTGRDGMLSQDFQLSIFRTPNLAYTQSGYACYQPRMMSSQMVLGALYPELDYAGGLEGGYDDPEYCVPELMVLWGKMPLASNPDGFSAMRSSTS